MSGRSQVMLLFALSGLVSAIAASGLVLVAVAGQETETAKKQRIIAYIAGGVSILAILALVAGNYDTMVGLINSFKFGNAPPTGRRVRRVAPTVSQQRSMHLGSGLNEPPVRTGRFGPIVPSSSPPVSRLRQIVDKKPWLFDDDSD